MIPLPDLLYGERHASRDDELLLDLLEMAFLGSNESRAIDVAIDQTPVRSSAWAPVFFEDDLFLDDLARDFATLRVGERDQRMHTAFFRRVLRQPPLDPEVVRFRQEILRELESDGRALARTEALYNELATLLDLIKSAYSKHLDDNIPQRLQVLRQARDVVDRMASDFGDMESGLARIGEVGREIQETEEYAILTALLDYEDNLAKVELQLRIGADGRIKNLEIRELAENVSNRFHKAPWRRWIELFKMYWRGYSVSRREVVNRVVVGVYVEILPALSTLVQLMGHVEVYLISRAFARRARERGLEVCLADLHEGGEMELERLFNPLLLPQAEPPVPCDLSTSEERSVVIVTGPNSGGKTRLLQGVGLVQLLGQSGLYTSARRARLPLMNGTFASLVYRQSADQLEGHLGTELMRIRTLFQGVGRRSLILLDELCSGTNPSEAVEIVTMVLQLLQKLSPVAFITTHFLDLAKELKGNGRVAGLDFLQVEVDDNQESTYQFIPGVAETSLAADTARRLGVDFEQLSALIEERVDGDEA